MTYVTLVGPIGAGKSSLIKKITGKDVKIGERI